MASIAIEPGGATIVHVFTVDLPDQPRLLAMLQAYVDEVIRRMPGFLGASVLRNLDGECGTVVSHWRTMADWEAMLRNAEARRRLNEILAFTKDRYLVHETAAVYAPYLPEAA